MKISKLLPIALAFTLCTTGAFAVDGSPNANTEYSLTVSDFLNITYETGTQSSTVTPQLNNEDNDYTIAQLEGALTGNFRVITNHEQDVYLYGSCKTSDGTGHALFGEPEGLILVFANESVDKTRLATDSGLATVEAGTPDPTATPNAIAFNMTVTPAMVDGSHNEGDPITTADELVGGALKYTLPNSVTNFPISITGNTVAGTLSTLDETGTYKATLYLTNTAPAASL